VPLGLGSVVALGIGAPILASGIRKFIDFDKEQREADTAQLKEVAKPEMTKTVEPAPATEKRGGQPNFLQSILMKMSPEPVSPLANGPPPTATLSPLKQAVSTTPSPALPDDGGGVTPSPRPTPTIHPRATQLYGESIPYKDLIGKYFSGEENRAINTFVNESDLKPNVFHVNGLWRSGMVVKPEEVEEAKKQYPDHIIISTPQEWESLRRQYPSIDVGLTQLNTADAMNKYLEGQGLTYFDLMTAPEGAENALRIGADLLYGRIPYTAPGWQNWVAYNNMPAETR